MHTYILEILKGKEMKGKMFGYFCTIFSYIQRVPRNMTVAKRLERRFRIYLGHLLVNLLSHL